MEILSKLGTTLEKWWLDSDTVIVDALFSVIKLILIFVLARLVIFLARRITGVVTRRRFKSLSDPSAISRLRTTETMVVSVVKYLAFFFGIAFGLDALGLGVSAGSLLATAGIGGVAIGFGAQDLVKDVVAGVFLLFENQFVVGDYIEVLGVSGTVEAITLRLTQVRGFEGELTILSNRNITQVVNHTRGASVAIVDVDVPYEQDLTEVFHSIERAGRRLVLEMPALQESPRVLGVSAVHDGLCTVRVVCKVEPLQQWATERALRKCIKEQFEQDGIAPPYPRSVSMEIVAGGAGGKADAASE